MHASALAAQTQQIVSGKQEPEEQQYLTFMLSGETYAISILRIKEIIQCSEVTEVPRLPNFIRGVINLRGAVVPMIDLSAHFSKQSASIGRRNGIIVIEVTIADETHSVGVMVDAVNAVLEISDSEIETPSVLDARLPTDFIAGTGKINGRFVSILNIQEALSMEDIAMLATAESATTTGLTQVSSYKVATAS